jgi:hypothetical protein
MSNLILYYIERSSNIDTYMHIVTDPNQDMN